MHLKKCSTYTHISILAISLSNNYIGCKHTIVAKGGYHNNHRLLASPLSNLDISQLHSPLLSLYL